MRHFELAGARAVTAPLHDELAVLRELHDARVAAPGIVTVGNKNIAIGSDRHGVRLIERIGPIAGDSRFSESHQDFSFRTELENLVALLVVALTVGEPDCSVLFNRDAVR